MVLSPVTEHLILSLIIWQCLLPMQYCPGLGLVLTGACNNAPPLTFTLRLAVWDQTHAPNTPAPPNHTAHFAPQHMKASELG